MERITQITQIAENIFKVVHKNDGASERDSLIITANTNEYRGNGCFECKTSDGLASFYKNGNEIISEISSIYTQSFKINEDDAVYGLGIHQHKSLNHRNSSIRMAQINGVSTAVPFFTSTGGYAVLIDNYSFMSIGIDRGANFNNNDLENKMSIPNTININADDNDCFVYYMILADKIDEQIAAYRYLTGAAPLFPKWAYGFFQCREHYRTQEEILDVARTIRKHHIPADCIVQDWNYWGEHGWNALLWDKNKYPSPEEMISEIHDKLNLKLMISVWPSFGPDTEVTKKLEAVGGILEKPGRKDENWGRVHDPLNPKAADIIWNGMKKELFDKGVDAWWLDSTEPAFEKDSSLKLLEASDCALGKNKDYLNTFAFASSKNTYTHQRADRDDKRVFILTRSGFAGLQSVGTLTWTGDIEGSWEVLKRQIISLLGYSASGIPYSTTDIGGFFVNYPNGNKNEEYRELYTRWFWFGAFSPIFRSHGTSTPREMWFFGEEGTKYYDSLMECDKLRYRLLPYIYSNAYKITSEGYTIMRPLVMDFPNDKNVINISDSFMFGDALLVNPVTEAGAVSRKVYLPINKSGVWYDYFTGEKYDCGQTIDAAAPIEHIPLFVNGGSIILTGSDCEYVAAQDKTTIDVNIYTGCDCDTFIYTDSGDGYAYEKGEYAKIDVSYRKNEKKLTFSDVSGNCSDIVIPNKMRIFVNGKHICDTDYYGKETCIELN